MTITNERWRYDMRVAIITANTDIYKGTKANESGEAVKLVAEEAGLEVVCFFFIRNPLALFTELLSDMNECFFIYEVRFPYPRVPLRYGP